MSCVGTSTGTSFELRFAPSSKRWTSGVKPIRSIVCSSERSATTRTASVFDTTRSSCDDVVVGKHGTTTPPTFQVPRMASSQSTVLPRDHDHAIAGADASLAQSERPDRRTFGDLAERAVLDDPLAREERQRTALGIARECLDDVAREVEAIGDLPAAVDERRSQRKLERRAGQLVSTPAASADAKTFLHGLAIIDPKGPELNADRSPQARIHALREFWPRGSLKRARPAARGRRDWL